MISILDSTPFASASPRLAAGPGALRPRVVMTPAAHEDMAADEGGGDGPGPDGNVAVATKPATRRPSMYKVLMLNDDYTPMEFVVHVLERFFGIGHDRAQAIMMTVHRRGVAVVGVFSFEVAETKVTQVMEYAQQHQHPLQCTLEKE